MQHRPKLWIGTLVVLYLIGFEVGFQPLRVIPRQGAGPATFEFDLGQPAATSDDALAKKAADMQAQLLQTTGRDAKWLQEFRFTGPQTLRASTVTVTDKQREEDRGTILGYLKKEFPKAQGAVVTATAEQPVASLGPFGLYRPAPHVHLGLDLQGGAHVVLQAQPSTEMTFATPEDRPMVVEEKTPPTEAGKPEAAKTGEAAKPEKPADAGAANWKPDETSESLQQKLTQVLTTPNAPVFTVQVVANNRVVVDSQATKQADATAQYRAVLAWLQQKYAGVKIDAPEPSSVFITTDTADKAKHIIDLRLYSMSDIKEPVVQKQGSDRIIVELPGVREPKRVTDILRSTARLEFRLVPKRYEPAAANDYSTWKDSQTGATVGEKAVMAQAEAKFSGRDLKPNAMVEPEPQTTNWEVRFELKEDRKQAFSQFTRDNVGRIMAIVLDKETKMAPVIRSEIPGVGVISGNMTTQESGDLKLLLNAGALPVPLKIVENRQVSATLGEGAVRQSVTAGIVGFIIVVFFMVLYYRLPGLLADVALTLYVILMLALLSTWSPLETTLTLPGIAGIILSIGMAVDANVIIFERIREELRTRTTTRAAVEAGFHRAWPAILDSNVTTVIGAAALYFFGTSSVKSFAVTLLLGVCTHLFTAVTASRWLVHIVARTHLGENRAMWGVEPLRSGSVSSSPAGGSE